MIKYKKQLLGALIITSCFAVFHFLLLFTTKQVIGIESVLLGILPYGLPVVASALAYYGSVKDAPLWSKPARVAAVLCAICYTAMVTQITLVYFIGCVALGTVSYVSLYFNTPIYYGIVFAVLSVICFLLRRKKGSDASAKTELSKPQIIVGRLLFALPILLIVAMVIHCGVLLIIGALRVSDNLSPTSFPFYAVPLLVSFAYLLAVGVAFAVWALYTYLVNRKATSK